MNNREIRKERFKERYQIELNRREILSNLISKLEISDCFIIDDISFRKGNIRYYSKELLGDRTINPYNYSPKMIKKNGQFSYLKTSNFESNKDRLRDHESMNYEEIYTISNEKVLNFFTKEMPSLFPKFLGEDENFWKFEYFEGVTIPYILENGDNLEKEFILKELYKIYEEFSDAEILPGNNLHDYILYGDRIIFNNIENIVYNYFKTYRRFLYEIPELTENGTEHFKFMDFRFGKTSEEFIDIINKIKLTESMNLNQGI